VWTYVGRSQYASGKLSDARPSLERALSRYRDDYLGRIYLGLTLIRQQESAKGLKEFEEGIRGLDDWLEYVANYSTYGQFWDPRREIRSEIQGSLAMIEGREMNLEKVIASGEWLGKNMEEEIDLARRDEDNAYKQGDGRHRLWHKVRGPSCVGCYYRRLWVRSPCVAIGAEPHGSESV